MGANTVGINIFAGAPPDPVKGTGRVFYVGNASTYVPGGVAGSDTAGPYGDSPKRPFATVDYAIGQCTAGRGDVIFVLPGHNEGGTGVLFDADVSGISIIGLGVGELRPRFDYDNAAATIDVGADNVTLKNLVLLPSVTSVLVGIDLESGSTSCVLEDLEFAIGEDGSGTDEFVKAIVLTSGNHDTILRNVKILAHASATHATHGIHVDAASNRLTIDGVVIDGPYATAGILEDAAGVNHVVTNNAVDVTGTNYNFASTSTFAQRGGNLDGGISEGALGAMGGLNTAPSVVSTVSQSLAAATGAIFTVTGIVKVKNIVGNVTTVVGTSTSMQLKAGATTISASTDITTATTLSLYLRESALASALTKIVTNTASLHATPTELLVGSAGSTTTIYADLNASGTGVIQWALEYIPLSKGAKVVAAQ